MYAVGTDARMADPSRRLLQAIRDETIQATTTAEVVQEFAHVYGRRRSRREAVHLATAYADLLSPLVTVERGDLDDGLTLFERLPGLGSFDAVLAAIALNRRFDALVSADRAFAEVPRLRYVDLLSAIDELLA